MFRASRTQLLACFLPLAMVLILFLACYLRLPWWSG